MLTQEQFAQAIRSFLNEMSLICIRQTPASLKQLPGFEEELAEAVSVLRDPMTSENSVLSTAFGIVDEFTERGWDDIIAEAYAAYAAERRPVQDR